MCHSVWRSEDNSRGQFSLSSMWPTEDGIQVIGVGGQCLNPLSPLVSPWLFDGKPLVASTLPG